MSAILSEPETEKKLFSNIINKLKKIKNIPTQSQRILSSTTEMIKKASVNTAENSKKVIYTGANMTVKTFNFSQSLIFKSPLIIFLFYIFLSYGTLTITKTSDISTYILKNYMSSFLSDISIYWLSILITAFISILIITLLLPVKPEEKNKWFEKELRIFLSLTMIIIVIGIIVQSSFMQNYTTSEKIQIAKTNVQKNSQSLWEKISCSFSPSCIQKELNQNQAKQSKSSDYSVSLTKPTYSQFTLNDLKNPLILNYNIKSTGNLILTKIECYLDKKEGEPFYTKKENINLNTNGASIYPSGIECGNLKNTIKLKKQTEEHTIIPVLFFTINSTYQQQIPIINYNKFLEEEGFNPNKKYSYIYLKKTLDAKTINYKQFIESSNALSVDNSILKDKLPLLLGDQNERDMTFPLIIKENNNNDFGTFVSGKITKIDLPSTLEFQKGYENYKNLIKLKDNNQFEQNIHLKENEGGIDMGNTLLAVQSLKIYITANFEKEDRFKITVTDENFDKHKENSTIQKTTNIINYTTNSS